MDHKAAAVAMTTLPEPTTSVSLDESEEDVTEATAQLATLRLKLAGLSRTLDPDHTGDTARFAGQRSLRTPLRTPRRTSDPTPRSVKAVVGASRRTPLRASLPGNLDTSDDTTAQHRATFRMHQLEAEGNPLQGWLDMIAEQKKATGGPCKHILQTYERATAGIPVEENRKSEVYSQLWLEYARLQARTSREDARDAFNYMKNERIGQTFRLYYAVRADFEASAGNGDKVSSILGKGKACPPISATAAASEAAFLQYLAAPSVCRDCRGIARGRQQQSQPQQTPLRTPMAKATQITDVMLSGNVSTRKKQRRPPVKRLGLASFGLGPAARATRVMPGLQEEAAAAAAAAAPLALPLPASPEAPSSAVGPSDARPQQATGAHTAHPGARPPNPRAEAATVGASVAKRKESKPHYRPAPVSQPAPAIPADSTETVTVVSFKKTPVTPVQAAKKAKATTHVDETEAEVFFTANQVAPPATRDVTEMTVVSFPTRKAAADTSKPSKNEVSVSGIIYTKIERLGKGGSSLVYRVLSNEDHKMYGLKEVDLSQADEETVETYMNEVHLLEKLRGKQNIIQLYNWELNQAKKVILLVMECGDVDLSTMLKKRRSTKGLDENHLRLHWQTMLEAVQTIHEARIVHGDLKPANFLFVSGSLKLIDFGIARGIQDEHTSIFRDTQIGTLNYMSPEAIQDTSGPPAAGGRKGKHDYCLKIGPASDVWSLGCILYSMVYGKTPFQHLRPLQKLQAITSPDHQIEFGSLNNKALLKCLKACLNRNPRERPTITQLLQDRFLNPQSLQTPPRQSTSTAAVSQEQLMQILSQLPYAGTLSPGSVSRKILAQLQGGGAVPLDLTQARTPKSKSTGGRQPSTAQPSSTTPAARPSAHRQPAPGSAPRHAKTHQSRRPRAALQALDPNALKVGQAKLKPLGESSSHKHMKQKAVAKGPASMGELLQEALHSKYKNALPSQDATEHTMSEWRTDTIAA